MNLSMWEKIRELQRRGTPYAVVTMASLRGHAPQEVGAKALFSAEGIEWGTIGGGKLEAKVIALVKEKILQGQPCCELLAWNLQRDVGMTCGGEVTLLLEIFAGGWSVVVFGAGHVSQALVRALSPLACRLKVFDTREKWLERLPESPNLEKTLSTDLESEVQGLPPGAFVVVLTQGHATDLPVIKAALRWKRFGYLGVLGSPVKAIKIRNELQEWGADPGAIETLHCPIGLPLGNNTPEEIAISISAQLIQERDRLSR